MRRAAWLTILCAILTLAGPRARAEQMSALIGQAMDQQLPSPELNFSGTLPGAISKFADLTGVRIEADESVYDALPWGDLTTFHAVFHHQTLRQALDAICQKLGLEIELQEQSVELRPIPALSRLGRRCTVEELQALDYLSRTELTAGKLNWTAGPLLTAIDSQLEKTPYAIENRAFDPQDNIPVNISRHCTLAGALEEISAQTHATWYPWGRTIVVLKKSDQIRMQLSRRITLRADGQDVSDVLLELSQRSGLTFQIQPGAIQQITPQFRTIRLTLDNATVEQSLESLCGFTGLGYAVTDGGVYIWYAAPPATQPAIQ
jgi:hypothetical protein